MTTKEEWKEFREALDWGIGTIEKMLAINDFPLTTLMEISEYQADYLFIIKETLNFVKEWSEENEHQANGN